MSHEPECSGRGDVLDGLLGPRPCICGPVRAAHRRGRVDERLEYGDAYDKGYRNGYNDHARSRAFAEAVYGPYNKPLGGAVVAPLLASDCNQHGKGENP